MLKSASSDLSSSSRHETSCPHENSPNFRDRRYVEQHVIKQAETFSIQDRRIQNWNPLSFSVVDWNALAADWSKPTPVADRVSTKASSEGNYFPPKLVLISIFNGQLTSATILDPLHG